MIAIKRFGFFFLPFAAALLGSLLLFLVSFIPSDMLHENAVRSAAELERGGSLLGDDRMAYIMDYNTDAIIMMESYTLSGGEGVFSNPMRYMGECTQVASFQELLTGEAANVSYVRYWMGYRILFRPLLALFSYDGICWLLSMIFFASAFASLIVTASAERRSALCFAAALCLINPAVTAHSPQFSCCYLLCFAFILWMRTFGKSFTKYGLIFCAFGAITQYFDFYTSPLVTLGFPLLLLLELDAGKEKPLTFAASCSGAWLYGYAAMWLSKLALTTLFTGVNAFENGLLSLAGRIGLKKVAGLDGSYSVLSALKAVWTVAFPGALALVSLVLFLLAVAAASAVYLRFSGAKARRLAGAELFVSALPLVWYAVAAQPSTIHAWFQYRNLSVVFFGLFLYVSRAVMILRTHSPITR